MLTNKSEKQNENPFLKYYVGNNVEEKIDFKQNNENKKNIFSHTYIDNEEEEESNKEKIKRENNEDNNGMNKNNEEDKKEEKIDSIDDIEIKGIQKFTANYKIEKKGMFEQCNQLDYLEVFNKDKEVLFWYNSSKSILTLFAMPFAHLRISPVI